MSTVAKEKKKVTLQSTAMAVAIWVKEQREKLEGKTFNEISGIIRKQFSGKVVGDSAIRDALEHGQVNWKRTERQVVGAGQDRVRTLARIVTIIVARIEGTGQSLLDPQERAALRSIADGIAPPRLPLFDKPAAPANAQANGHANGHTVASN